MHYASKCSMRTDKPAVAVVFTAPNENAEVVVIVGMPKVDDVVVLLPNKPPPKDVPALRVIFINFLD